MKRRDVIVLLKLLGIALFVGYAFVLYLHAPVLDKISFQLWRVIGWVGAAAIGGIGALMAGCWIRVGFAHGIGLLIGAAYAEFSVSDVSIGPIDSLTTAIFNEGYLLISPFIVAGFAGAFIAHSSFFRKARCKPIESDC